MNRVRELRQSLLPGVSAAEFARRVGMERSDMSRLETGVHQLNERKAAAIAKVLGCAIGDLFEEPEPRIARATAVARALAAADAAACDQWLEIGERLCGTAEARPAAEPRRALTPR